MDVSIIIINYNTTEMMRQCLQSVIEHTKQNTYELIVVDNASSDRAIESLQSEFEQVIFIFNEQNEGFGRANNKGINIAGGKYLFLLNSDTWLLNDAVSVFWEFMESPSGQSAGCCGGDLLMPNGNKQVSYGNFPSLAEAFSVLGFYRLYKSYFYRHISSGVKNTDDQMKEVDYISGADMFLRKSVLEHTGAFDPDFFLYFEETELSYRIKKAGFKSYLLPLARIVHLEGASQTNQLNFDKMKIYTRSRSLFFKKCYGRFHAFAMNAIYYLKAIAQYLVSFGKTEYLKTARIVRTQNKL